MVMKKRLAKKLNSPFYMVNAAERRFAKNDLVDYVTWAEFKYSRITNRMLNEVYIAEQDDFEYQMIIRGLSYQDLY